MTFEDNVGQDRGEATNERGTPKRGSLAPPTWSNKAADEMLEFVDQSGIVADRLRGLVQLFRGTFLPDDGSGPQHYADAAEIVADCIENIARRLDDNLTHARARRDHLARGAQ